MRLYCEREGYIPEARIELFREIVATIQAIPEMDPPEKVSCHVLARVLEKRFVGVKAVDGFFQSVGSNHAWLDLGDGVVADVYPIGGVVPFLVDTSGYLNPWNRMYIKDPKVVEGLDVHPDVVADEVLAAMDGQKSA